MDPDVCLARIRELTTCAALALGDARMEFLEDLAEQAQALDEWLTKGGFLPQAWAENCDWDRQMREQHIARRHRP
jgi:hypothetical protein